MMRALLVALLGVAASVSACRPNNALDSQCTPDEPDITVSEDCIRSDGLGPQVDNDSCVPLSQQPLSDPAFAEVAAMMFDPNRGGCNDAACHDADAPALDIHFPEQDLPALYEVLTTTQGLVGKPYVNPDDPLDSWMHCNLRPATKSGQIGSPMPKTTVGLENEQDLQLVEDWIVQGAKPPTGMGGMGGMGGAGGMGGGT